MVKLLGMLSQISPAKVLVVGDFMLDTYTTGKVGRISPEAPVPVLHVKKQESLPGGAGNVVLNLLSLGADVVAMGRVGNDAAGQSIVDSLEKAGASVEGIVFQPDYATPVKNRLIADSQQVIRVDFEENRMASEELEDQLIAKLPELLEGCAVMAISDYGKGLHSPRFMQAIIQSAKERKVPTIVDPKGLDFTKYAGATILKPNLGEAYAAARLSKDITIDEVAVSLLKGIAIEQLLITRSSEGISLFNQKGERSDFPVRSKEVKDVTGAGDTVLAVLSLIVGNGIDLKVGAQIANIAAGIAIERIGCARVSLAQLADRLFELDVENKIFDGEHLSALQQAVKDKDCRILTLQSHHGMSTTLFKSIRTLSTKKPDSKLLVFIRDRDYDREFISLLCSLQEIDFIVVASIELNELAEKVSAEEVYGIEGDRLTSLGAALV